MIDHLQGGKAAVTGQYYVLLLDKLKLATQGKRPLSKKKAPNLHDIAPAHSIACM